MEVIGEAIGFAKEGLFKPALGLQIYVSPPVAFNVAAVPKQIVVSEPALIIGTTKGFALTLLLLAEIQLPTVCVAVSVVGLRKVLGLPLPKSLQFIEPITPDAITSELPQVSTTAKVGAAGTTNGLVVTLLLLAEIQPATSCVTVTIVEVMKFLGLPLPKSLQNNVPVTPDAVTSELPQLSVTAKLGEAGIAFTVI